MSWYKYWYYTIFFIYDSFGKDREQNKAFSVVCFSFIIYMVYSLLGAYTNMMFENPILKYIAHPCSHFILYNNDFIALMDSCFGRKRKQG